MDEAVNLYDRDFVVWAEAQARALREAAGAGSNLAVDWINVDEEIDGLAKGDRRELRSRLATILEHLLKLQFSSAEDPRAGWESTISQTRDQIADILEDSPSLRREVSTLLAGEARRVGKRVARELSRRSEQAPDLLAVRYDEAQILDDWFPDQRADVR